MDMSKGTEGIGKSFAQAIQETFSGFSECWELGPKCTVDWSAWGTWAGAAATFFAVLLPYLAAKRATRLRAQLAIGDFIRELNLIALQLATAAGALEYPLNLAPRDVVSMLRVRAVLPVLEADPSVRKTLLEIRNLGHQLENWNLAVDLLLGPGEELLFHEGWAMDNARKQLTDTSNAVSAVARAIVAELPELEGSVGTLAL